MTSAKIIADSTCHNVRLTTIEASFPRIILPQVLTHRMWARNTASSRAIPTSRYIERVKEKSFVPMTFRQVQKGMVAGEVLSEEKGDQARLIWQEAMNHSVSCASKLADLKVSKEHVNRLLEPFSYVTMLITATEWTNFFNLRLAHDAQPEIQTLALCIHKAIKEATPTPLGLGGWHIPYNPGLLSMEKNIKASIGRCARVSYLTHDGKSDPKADIELYDRLVNDKHLSPLEHVAYCMNNTFFYANYKGFCSYRYLWERKQLSSCLMQDVE